MIRPALPAALLLLAAILLPPAPARAVAPGDESAEAAARFADKYLEGVEGMTPEEVDKHRGALLEPVVASGSAAGFQKVLAVARERGSQVDSFRKRLKDIAEEERQEAQYKDDSPKAMPGGPTPKQMMEKIERRKEDKVKVPLRIEREVRWQKRLAEALGTLLDALPDADFARVAIPALKETLGDLAEDWGGWLASSVGRSHKERTAKFLLESAAESLDEYRRNLVARAGPAKDLDKVNQDISDRVQDYLLKQQQRGDFSAQIPQGLIPDSLQKEQNRLEAVVAQIFSSMDRADIRRNAARRCFGGMLAGTSEDQRGKLLDLLEKGSLGSKDFEERGFGLLALGPCPGDRAMKFLREAAKDPAAEVVVAALEALGGRTEAEAQEILAAAVVGDARWQVRGAAAAGLADYGRAVGVPPLIAAMEKAEGRTVDDLEAALVRLTGKRFPPVAAAWQEWWARSGTDFRGPRDPDRKELPPENGGPPGEKGVATGDGVSFYGIETKSKRILFILDCSGSMQFAGSATDASKKKIDVLFAEMRKTITGLPDGAKFNMITFSSDVRVWRKGPAVRDAKVAKEAIEWVEKQKVVGSTNIYDALETAFKMMGVGAAKDKSYEPVYDTIFFMTDGTPTSGKVIKPDLIRGDVRRWNEGRKIRIHVVGMGGKTKPGGPGSAGADDLDRDFLKKLAEDNQGECVFK